MQHQPAIDRYEAAVRLERIRQQMREATRYGFVITRAQVAEAAAAEAEYDAATADLI
jgi:hypothetical protein